MTTFKQIYNIINFIFNARALKRKPPVHIAKWISITKDIDVIEEGIYNCIWDKPNNIAFIFSDKVETVEDAPFFLNGESGLSFIISNKLYNDMSMADFKDCIIHIAKTIINYVHNNREYIDMHIKNLFQIAPYIIAFKIITNNYKSDYNSLSEAFNIILEGDEKKQLINDIDTLGLEELLDEGNVLLIDNIFYICSVKKPYKNNNI